MSAIDLILFNMLQIITAFYCLAPNCNPSSIYGPLKIGAIISWKTGRCGGHELKIGAIISWKTGRCRGHELKDV